MPYTPSHCSKIFQYPFQKHTWLFYVTCLPFFIVTLFMPLGCAFLSPPHTQRPRVFERVLLFIFTHHILLLGALIFSRAFLDIFVDYYYLRMSGSTSIDTQIPTNSRASMDNDESEEQGDTSKWVLSLYDAIMISLLSGLSAIFAWDRLRIQL
jgi:hypothetical protein